MPSKKVYIILIAIMVVSSLIMFLIFGVKNIQQENLQTTIIVGDQTTWSYQNQKWIYVRKQSSLQDLSWEKYHVYENNEDRGVFYLWHDDKWYFFDEAKEAVSLTGKTIAYLGNYDMKVLDFQESEIGDKSFVYAVLEDNGLSTSSQFSSIYKVSLDFDGDQKEEDFYAITNVFPFDFEADTTFSIAFMVKDDMIYYLYQDVGPTNGLNGCKPFYHSFIDTNMDGKYEVILSCGRYSASDQVDMLFQFEEGAFKLLVSNQ